MKITLHPLFYGVIIACALFGGLPATVICLLTALLHECGHIFCAARMGFECKQIRLMPYGAAAVCDIDGISAADEIKLALAGPAVNAFLCVAVAGLWWFFPEAYAYTDTVMYANLSMLAVNLLPAYPLDGGRAAGRALSKFFGKRAATIILKVISLLCAVALGVLFFVCGYNPTFAAFALFLVFSAIEKPPQAELVNFSYGAKLKRGIEVKYVLCDRSLTYAKAFRLLDGGRYLVLQLYEDGICEEITQDELYERAAVHSFSDGVFEDGEDYFSRKDFENLSLDIAPSTTSSTHAAPSASASSTAPEREA